MKTFSLVLLLASALVATTSAYARSGLADRKNEARSEPHAGTTEMDARLDHQSCSPENHQAMMKGSVSEEDGNR